MNADFTAGFITAGFIFGIAGLIVGYAMGYLSGNTDRKIEHPE